MTTEHREMTKIPLALGERKFTYWT